VNLYAFALLDGGFSEERIGGALRAEVAWQQLQIAASFAARGRGPTQLGLDVSAGVGPVDLFAEVALEHGLVRTFWEGSFTFDPLELPEPVDQSDRWFLQAAGGAELSISYTDRDVVQLGAEYFYNQTGYPNGDLHLWLLARDAFGASREGPEFIPFRLGRHYAAAFILLPSPGDLEDMTFRILGIGNLSDRSFLARLDWFATVFSFVRINLFTSVHFGRIGELRLEIDIPPTDLSPILEDGFYVPPPRLNAGIEVRVSI
jgi:hypothetical protein